LKQGACVWCITGGFAASAVLPNAKVPCELLRCKICWKKLFSGKVNIVSRSGRRQGGLKQGTFLWCISGSFAASAILPNAKSPDELLRCEIDDSASERFYDEFRSGVKSSCAPNLNWGAAKLESGKRDRKLAPKQLCEEFRAGGKGGCAPNLNPRAEYADAQSSWMLVGAGIKA